MSRRIGRAGLIAAMVSAVAALSAAIWTVNGLPDTPAEQGQVSVSGQPESLSPEVPQPGDSLPAPVNAGGNSPVQPPVDRGADVSKSPAEPAMAAPRAEAPDAWLDPHYGLATADERDAIDALLSLADTLDFRTFGARIKSLTEPEQSLADYLLLEFRAFLVLDTQLTESAFVREPYLEQARAAQATDNWPSWVFLDMPVQTPLTPAQLEAGIQAALRGHHGAQAVFARRSAWFSSAASPTEAAEIRQQMQAGNPYLDLLQLQRTGRNLWRRPESRAALSGIRERLRRSADPLSQWLAAGLPDPDRSEAAFASDQLTNIAGIGYLTALEEVRLLATRGSGRWSATDAVSVQDAVTVFRQLEARLPDNPVISGSLCELSLHQGDYQAAWNYLQKMAYTDRWAEEVEDYSCLPGQSDEFARQMIRFGVITEDQWAAHRNTIDRRRRSIRAGESPGTSSATD